MNSPGGCDGSPIPGARRTVAERHDLITVRPSADVIIPFHGSRRDFGALADRISRLRLGSDDSLIIVDNTPTSIVRQLQPPAHIGVVLAPERQSSYYARNRGAAVGRGTWLVFLDVDVEPVPDLIDRYLTVPPAPETAVLCGLVRDIRATNNERESLASRYSRLRRLIDQANTLKMDRPYAKTANCAVRRTAFEQVDGFIGGIRSGGDADLCFRLLDVGWQMELRLEAAADHRARRTLIELLGQRARHGSGAEWLEARYPGFVGPRLAIAVLARRVITGAAASSAAAVRRRNYDEALVRLLDPISNAAFDVGRRIPNTPWREQLTGVFDSGRLLPSIRAHTDPRRP